MGVFLWLPCARCFGVEELAEQFVPRGSRVKHAKVKVWSSAPIVPNMPYYLFEVSECRNSFSFCSEKPACEDASSNCERSWGLNNKMLRGSQSLFTSQIKTVCLITAATDVYAFSRAHASEVSLNRVQSPTVLGTSNDSLSCQPHHIVKAGFSW